MKRLIYILLFGLILTNITGYSQVTSNDLIGSENAIEYAVPFLIIAPDSRAGAMGDAGVATSPDYNSMHWNAAKYAFIESDLGISVSYTPWLRNLIGDIDLAYVSAFKRIDQRQTVAATLLYFSLGEIQFTNDIGELLNVHKPNEFSVDVAYARSFSDNISGLSVTLYVILCSRWKH